MTKTERKHLAALKKREAFLSKRVEGRPPETVSFDRGERAALRWAIEQLEKEDGETESL